MSSNNIADNLLCLKKLSLTLIILSGFNWLMRYSLQVKIDLLNQARLKFVLYNWFDVSKVKKIINCQLYNYDIYLRKRLRKNWLQRYMERLFLRMKQLSGLGIENEI